MNFIRSFIYIVIGALAASIIGGIFACAVALVSPEFVASLFARPANGAIVRYAAGVGMIWGIFLGTAAMAFSLLLTTLIHVARLIKKKSEESEISNRRWTRLRPATARQARIDANSFSGGPLI